MDQKNLDKENLFPSGTCSKIAPILHELPVNEGAWLKFEEDTNSTCINHRIGKKALVSLHVNMEESEHEFSLAPVGKKSSRQEIFEGSGTDNRKKT